MKWLRGLLPLLLTSVVASGGFAMAEGPIRSNTNDLPVLSDAAAGCSYGTRALAPTDYLPPGALKNESDSVKISGTRDRCSIFFNWGTGAGAAGATSGISYVSASSDAMNSPNSTQSLCASPTDPKCAPEKFPQGSLRADPLMYKCETSTDLNCIASLEVIDPTGKIFAADYLRNFPETPILPASSWSTRVAGKVEKMSYPKGGAIPVWGFTAANEKISIATQGVVERTWQSVQGEWSNPSAIFQFKLVPVRIVSATGATKPEAYEESVKNPDGTSITKVFTQSRNAFPEGECRDTPRVSMDQGFCALSATFPEGYRYRVTFQLPDDLGFFLNGRIDAPIAYTEPIQDGHRLVIEGGPGKSFALAGAVPKPVMTPELLNWIRSAPNLSGKFFQSPGDLPPLENRYPDLLNIMAPFFGDFTSYELTSWALSSTPNLGSLSSNCVNDVKGQMLGITSTNATAFDGNPPQIDPATKMFSYQVAAPHFSTDGKTPNVGRYFMNMNSKFATCLLGVSQVPVYATVGINYNSGSQSVSTVSVKQDKDWLRLSADNFSFSSPKIQIKFEEPANTPVITPSPMPVKQPVVVAKKTITCINGKTIKRVTAIAPICPRGYKLKK